MFPHFCGLPGFAGWIGMLVVWAAVVGLVVYFGYSRSHSHVGRGILEVHEDDTDIPPQPVPPLPGGIELD